MSMVGLCINCDHWFPPNPEKGSVINPNGEVVGACRRMPPTVMQFSQNGQLRFVTKFPDTKNKDWCGEFKKSFGEKEKE